MRLQGFGHRMGRCAGHHGADFLAPPYQFGTGYRDIGAFIVSVVDFTAKGVKRSNCAATIRRQKQEAVVKAGAALCGFLLAVFVGGHKNKALDAELSRYASRLRLWEQIMSAYLYRYA